MTNSSYGKLVNPRYYYGGDFDQKAWIELGVDGGTLIVRFSETKGGRSLVMRRVTRNADSRVPEAPTTAELTIEETEAEAGSGNRFGAIAYSSSSRQFGNATNYSTREAAEARARNECKSPDCRVQVWFRDACGALAGARNGQVGRAWANSEVEAQNKALEECGRKGFDCAVIASECSSSTTPSVRSATASLVSATPSSSPESIVTEAFSAFRQGNSFGVNTLMSAQGIANGATYCRGDATKCLRTNYADAGEPRSIKARVLSKSDSAADIELRTIWSAVEGEQCQTYNLDKTKDGWRITFFDGPRLCQ